MMMNRIKKCKDTYDRYFLSCDCIVGILLSIGIFTYLVYTGKAQQYYGNKKEISVMIINMAISLFGFVLTGITILITCMPQKLRKALNTTNRMFYNQIYAVFFSALKLLICATIIAVISVFTNNDSPILFFLTILFAILVTFRIARSIWILKHVIKIAQNE